MTEQDENVKKPRRSVLVAEDAEGVAANYMEFLKEDFDVVVCTSGRQVKKLIDQGATFDVAIFDIVMPPESRKQKLEDTVDTGMRLMARMIDENLCRRFYVITVRDELRDAVDRMCKDKAVYRFEHKLDHDPGELLKNVLMLLGQPL